MVKIRVIVLFLIVIAFSCSKDVYIEENIDVPGEYLEESSVSTQADQQTIDELNKLQQVKMPKYVIGPDDKFHAYVYNEEDLNTKELIVKRDGTMTFPLIGEVYVEGLELEEATELIEKKLESYISYPEVTIIPYEIKSGTVTILGKVTYPQQYQITGEMRILDLIAKAGGLALGYFQNNSIELADLERSFIVRNNKVLPIDFYALIKEGDMLNNIPLMGGDYIYLPSSINREVYVVGEVIEQGHFAYKENMTLGQVIAYSQGLKPSAKTSSIYLVRGNLKHPRLFKIDLDAIYKGKIMDFKLKPNDIIYVPKTPIASWNLVLEQILPSLQAVQTGYLLQNIIDDTNN